MKIRAITARQRRIQVAKDAESRPAPRGADAPSDAIRNGSDCLVQPEEEKGTDDESDDPVHREHESCAWCITAGALPAAETLTRNRAHSLEHLVPLCAVVVRQWNHGSQRCGRSAEICQASGLTRREGPPVAAGYRRRHSAIRHKPELEARCSLYPGCGRWTRP